MTSISYTEFRGHLSKWLNMTNDSFEPIVISRGKERKSVVLSFEEYQSLMETAYLLESEENRKHLDASLKELEEGKVVSLAI